MFHSLAHIRLELILKQGLLGWLGYKKNKNKQLGKKTKMIFKVSLYKSFIYSVNKAADGVS